MKRYTSGRPRVFIFEPRAPIKASSAAACLFKIAHFEGKSLRDHDLAFVQPIPQTPLHLLHPCQRGRTASTESVRANRCGRETAPLLHVVDCRTALHAGKPGRACWTGASAEKSRARFFASLRGCDFFDLRAFLGLLKLLFSVLVCGQIQKSHNLSG